MQKQHNEETAHLFTKAPPMKVFLALSLPVTLGMVITLVYNMVDAYFVGQLNDTNKMAAVSLCSPLFMLLMGMGNIFGIGGSSVVSRLMGQRRHDMVRRASSLCFWVSLCTGLVMASALLMLREQVLPILGTTEGTLYDTSRYYTWIVTSAPLLMMQFTLMNLLRCDGAARESMIGSILGSVVNMVLDPVFIFGIPGVMDGLGVEGAAIATVIGNLCTVCFFLYAATHRAPSLSLRSGDFAMDYAVLGSVLAIGLPASVTNALTSVATILLNNKLILFGEEAVAAMGLAGRLNQIVLLLQIGFAAGLPPVIGYNWGAGNMKRLREILKAAFCFALILGLSLTVIVYAFAPQALRLFMDKDEVIVPGTAMLRALMLSGPLLGALFIITNFFQASGKALPAMLLSLCRQGMVFVAVLFSFSAMFGWDGIIYAQPVSDYITLGIAVALFLHFAKPVLQYREHDA